MKNESESLLLNSFMGSIRKVKVSGVRNGGLGWVKNSINRTKRV
jgi:hypothetical protein